MDNYIRNYYNNDIKMEFVNHKLAVTTSYINSYYSLFTFSQQFENFYSKDLYMFGREDIISLIKSIAPEIKYTSALVYNLLLKDYKRWVLENHPDINVDLSICEINDLKEIDNFKSYTILNDDDIARYTQTDIVIDGGDYLSIIFMRLFWEIDAQETVDSILRIKISDLNRNSNSIVINNHEYNTSSYLTSLIFNFANKNRLEYRYSGTYKIPTAEENEGYILRTRKTHKTVLGEPLSSTRFSDIFHDFVERNFTDSFNINDLLMSLALKHMLKFKKSHTIMQTEKRYFNKMTSHVYGEVLLKYGKEKFPDLFDDYLQFYNNLKSNFC